MFQIKVAVLYFDKINIQNSLSCVRKSSIVGQVLNDTKILADSMLVFLLSNLHGKITKLNLCSKPVIKMISDYKKNSFDRMLGKIN